MALSKFRNWNLMWLKFGHGRRSWEKILFIFPKEKKKIEKE